MLDFGEVPLANDYPEKIDSPVEAYPLTVSKCKGCGHVQLNETVSPERLFSNYTYASSDSPALVKHFTEYANTVTSKFRLGDYSQILELGMNDGVLLDQFQKLGLLQLFGVDPAKNICELAQEKLGFPTKIINDFFNEETALKMRKQHGMFDIICANNVFAHVADLDSFTSGVKILLSKNGTFIFENAYLFDTINNLYLDQFYSEHLQYYGILPLVQYLDKFKLKIFDIQHVNTQGGSFRIFASHKDDTRTEPIVQQWIDEELQFGLYNEDTYKDFKFSLNDLQESMKNTMDWMKENNYTVSCYGCPAKFALLSKFFNFNRDNIRYVVDDSPLKYGRFSQGAKIPIVNNQHFKANPTDYTIISTWNMAASIMERNPSYNGTWIVPLPEIKFYGPKS